MTTFTYSLSGGTYIIEGTGSVQMIMLVRSRKEYFTDFIEREVKVKGLKVVVNGSFIDLSFASSIAVRLRDAALDASESMPLGEVIQDGKLLAGTSSTGKFNFSQVTCGKKFSAGLGNPSSSSCSAVGGIAPIIIDGLPYGAQNVYKAGVPIGAPPIGDVDAKFKPFLTQKSNAMFATLLSRGGTVGKTSVGYSNIKQKLFILSQANGLSGFDANGIRTIFVGNNVNNAVFLDCSDSSTLYYDGKFLVRPGVDKNEFLTVAVGFK